MDMPHIEIVSNTNYPGRRATLLLAKSAVAISPREEMSRYAAALANHPAAGASSLPSASKASPVSFRSFGAYGQKGMTGS
jgi:hypothetical protein